HPCYGSSLNRAPLLGTGHWILVPGLGFSSVGGSPGLDLVAGTRAGDLHRALVGEAGCLIDTGLAAPGRDQVGQYQPADAGLGGDLTRLPPGQMQIRRVRGTVDVAGLAEEHVYPLSQPDQRVTDPGVGRVRQRGPTVLHAYPVRFTRMVDPVHGDRERADRGRAWLQAVEGVDVVQRRPFRVVRDR